MNWYKALRFSNAVEKPMVIDEADLGVDPDCLSVGVRVDNWPANAWMRAKDRECDGDPDDVLQNYHGLPVFSPRLRDTLEANLIRGFQYLPVKVFAYDGAELEGFSIANYTELRPALDMKLSDYSVLPPDYFLPARRGWVGSLRRAVLIESQTLGCDALRLAQYDVYACVSERFKKLFEAGNFTGYGFRKLRVVKEGYQVN